MGGLAGIIYLDGREADIRDLERMTSVVRHRGPDGIGHWAHGQAAIAHLQLHTTPESIRESQPLVHEEGRLVVAMDGRIDNRREIIGRLTSSPKVSNNSTDIEILRQAFLKWGRKCVKFIEGDFAFVVWDSLNKTLFCARDPLGAKLFHYYYDGSRFIFGTEIKEILSNDDVPRQLNHAILGLYLCGRFGDGATTFYQSIYRLKGGCSLTVSADGLEHETFWNPNPYDQIIYKTESDYAEHLQDLAFQAVKCRMRSHSDLEISLSGGIDSGSVASLAGSLQKKYHQAGKNLGAHTYDYSNAPVDETYYARMVANKHHISHKVISVDNCWAFKEPETVIPWDEPFTLQFESMHHKGLQYSKENGIRVILTGEGGDEAFYPGYMLYLRDWLFALNLRGLWNDFLNGTPRYRRDGLSFLKRGLTPKPLRMPLRKAKNKGVPSWLDKGFAKDVRLHEQLESLEAYRYCESNYVQQRGYNPLFLSEDIRSSHYNIEVRHPLWDSRLVEFLFRIPPQVRFQGGREKLLFKRAMANIVPREVLSRKSHGAFAPMVSRGLRQMEATRIQQLVEKSALDQMGIINAKSFGEIYKSYRNGDESKISRLFWTIVTEDWLQNNRPGVEITSRGTGSTAIA